MDIISADSCGSELVIKVSVPTPFAATAGKEVGFTAEDDFHPGEKVVSEGAAELLPDAAENLGHGLGANVFGSVDTEAGETDGEKVDKVGGDAVLDVVFLGVEVGEAYEPALGDDVSIGPGVEGTLAMEVGWAVWDGGELKCGASLGVWVVEIGVAGGEVWRAISGVVAGI